MRFGAFNYPKPHLFFMRSLLLLASVSLSILMSNAVMAAPEPPKPKLVTLSIECRTTYTLDSLKRHITAAMPVFSASDLAPHKLGILDSLVKAKPQARRTKHVMARCHARRWQSQPNRYFTGRVSVPGVDESFQSSI
jgi:hypothetical protein